MCRSIHRLREGSDLAGPVEVHEAALQYVRKVSGFSRPAPHNQAAFDAAVEEVAAATSRLLGSLDVRGGGRAPAAAMAGGRAAARR